MKFLALVFGAIMLNEVTANKFGKSGYDLPIYASQNNNRRVTSTPLPLAVSGSQTTTATSTAVQTNSGVPTFGNAERRTSGQKRMVLFRKPQQRYETYRQQDNWIQRGSFNGKYAGGYKGKGKNRQQ